jgi:hypothetical protein
VIYNATKVTVTIEQADGLTLQQVRPGQGSPSR